MPKINLQPGLQERGAEGIDGGDPRQEHEADRQPRRGDQQAGAPHRLMRADHDEHDRVAQERGIVPEGDEVRLPRAGDGPAHPAGPAQIAHHQPRRQRGQNARHVQMLRHPKRPVGGDGGQGDLDEVILRAAGDQQRGQGRQDAHRDPASGHPDKGARDLHRLQLRAVCDRQEHCEGHCGGAVVQEALGLDQQAEARLDP